MATAEELLAGELGDSGIWFEVDLLSRRIVIPKEITNLGAKGDDDFMRARFKLPRFYYDIDFADFKLGIDYTNAQGEEDRYEPKDIVVGDDTVTFTWKVGRHAALYNGNVTFGLCAKRLNPADPDDPFNEFHTTKASLPILDAMETCEEAIIEHTDLLEQWRRDLFGIGDTEEQRIKDTSAAEQEAIANEGARVLATIPVDYQTAVSMTDNADRTKADAIICSAQGEVITVSDSSNDYLRGLRIFGKSTQDGTPTPDAPVDIASVENPAVFVSGKNLFDGTIHNIALAHLSEGGPRIMESSLYRGFYVCVQGGEKYTVSRATEETSRFQFACTKTIPSNGVLVDHIRGTNAGLTYTVTVPNGYHYLVVYLSNAAEDITVKNYQVEKGTTATEIEPFAGGVITLYFTLPGIPVSDGGNYTDASGQQWICDEIDLERGIFISRIATVYFAYPAYTEMNILENSKELRFWRDDMMPNSPVYCNKFQSVNSTWGEDTPYIIASGGSSGRDVCIRVPVDANLDYFTSNPTHITFIRVTPIETPLTAEEIAAFQFAHTNFPNTTVLNDAGAWMELKYNADTKTWLENLRKADSILKDTVTGKPYQLSVVNGKLTLIELEV